MDATQLSEGEKSMDSPDGKWYWITTDFFHNNGKKVCGPFTTMDDARVARAYIERLEGDSSYFIDNRPA